MTGNRLIISMKFEPFFKDENWYAPLEENKEGAIFSKK